MTNNLIHIVKSLIIEGGEQEYLNDYFDKTIGTQRITKLDGDIFVHNSSGSLILIYWYNNSSLVVLDEIMSGPKIKDNDLLTQGLVKWFEANISEKIDRISRVNEVDGFSPNVESDTLFLSKTRKSIEKIVVGLISDTLAYKNIYLSNDMIYFLYGKKVLMTYDNKDEFLILYEFFTDEIREYIGQKITVSSCVYYLKNIIKSAIKDNFIFKIIIDPRGYGNPPFFREDEFELIGKGADYLK